MNENDFIKVVNSNQFEIKAIYDANKNIKKVNYNISIYFFIPKNLNINELSYSKNDFYSEHTSFIRLKTPKNTFGVLNKQLSKILLNINNVDNNEFQNKIKLLVCSYTSYLDRFSKNFNLLKKQKKSLTILINRLQELDNIKNNFLLIVNKLNNKELNKFSKATIEYMSLSTQQYLLKLNIQLNELDDKYINESYEIINLINKEIIYCKNNNISIISNDDKVNETVIYRYSLLKKIFNEVLYLSPKRKKDGTNLKEFYYAIAAGISMVFATIVVFATQKEYGNFTTSFFVALVISYMFKDRLKEAYRDYFDKKIAINSYDFKEKIFNIEKTSVFAFLKEKMRFISKKNLSKEIINTRIFDINDDMISNWQLDEEILKYEKSITIYNHNIQKHYNNKINGINNIMRFDISKFFKKMSNNKIPLYKINSNKMYGSKVYHLNIIIEFKVNDTILYHKARLILNKKGIKRIEIPKKNLLLFDENKISNKKHWLRFKKSGLLKNIRNK